jgi:hypothetical protein
VGSARAGFEGAIAREKLRLEGGVIATSLGCCGWATWVVLAALSSLAGARISHTAACVDTLCVGQREERMWEGLRTRLRRVLGFLIAQAC